MDFPTLSYPETFRETVDVFEGLHRGLRIGTGEFSDMRNLTSDSYPVLATRPLRFEEAELAGASALIAKDSLCCVRGSALVVNGYPVELGLTAGQKQLVSMGPYIVIFPDKKYLNTADVTDMGSLEHRYSAPYGVTLAPCDREGSVITGAYVGSEAPQEPVNGQYWVDTSVSPGSAMQWSASSGMWVGLTQTYVKLSAPGIGAGFRQYDAVSLAGLTGTETAALNGTVILWTVSEDAVVISGIISAATQQGTAVTLERTVPDMDYVIESENRLWGCRFGVGADGKPVNEIYASKLGDFRNWRSYMGTAADSYAVSLGSDGPFTGAVTHMGYPLFFRENCMHKIYGSYPAAYRLQTTPCRGVQRGCHRSLAIVGETLYYKSPAGICAFDGSLPVEVSQKLGTGRYTDAAAGAIGSKYYISMTDEAGEGVLLVFDTSRHLWHREDSLRAAQFCTCRDRLYALEKDTGRLLILTGGGGTAAEETLGWMAETGIIGGSTPDAKYLTGLSVRMGLVPGARVRVSVCYDSTGVFEQVSDIVSHSLRSFSIPIRPRRCDHLQLRLEGTGEARVYSLTRTLEQGSDYF